MLRSGRFDHKIYFPPPDAADRTLILQSLVRDWGSTLNEQDLVTLGATTQGIITIPGICRNYYRTRPAP